MAYKIEQISLGEVPGGGRSSGVRRREAEELIAELRSSKEGAIALSFDSEEELNSSRNAWRVHLEDHVQMNKRGMRLFLTLKDMDPSDPDDDDEQEIVGQDERY